MGDIETVVIRASSNYTKYCVAVLGLICVQLLYYIWGFAIEGDSAGVILFGLIGTPIFLIEIWQIFLIFKIKENLTLDSTGVHYKPFSAYILGSTIPWQGIQSVSSARMGKAHYIVIKLKPGSTADSFHAGKFHELLYGKSVILTSQSLRKVNDRELIAILESYLDRYRQSAIQGIQLP
ncbi:MAG: hypothetical protein H7A06_04935 [Pseudomonadales bacterium]|nr:hypothetical protein [Pseudomonadales bacterium]